MIEITDSAKSKIVELLEQEDNKDLNLRTFIQGGGCSGFQYGFTFDDEQSADDFEFEIGSRKLLIDFVSMNYLGGAVIDYQEGLMGAGFSIQNPNAQSSCGCGNSFSV